MFDNPLIIIGFLSGVAFWFLVLSPMFKRWMEKQEQKQKMFDEVREKMLESFENSRIINEKIQSDEIPTDDDIGLYYKMYLKKHELDIEDQWDTHENKPMPFEEFDEKAKKESKEIPIGSMTMRENGRWAFLVQMTSDACINGSTFMRHRDYESMVKEDERKNNV